MQKRTFQALRGVAGRFICAGHKKVYFNFMTMLVDQRASMMIAAAGGVPREIPEPLGNAAVAWLPRAADEPHIAGQPDPIEPNPISKLWGKVKQAAR